MVNRGVFSMVTELSKEVSSRILWLRFAWFMAALVAWEDGTDVLRDRCLEPWAELWSGNVMFYSVPAELWQAELRLSSLVAVVFAFPLIGRHRIIFLANSLYREELRNGLIIWLVSWFTLWATCIIMVELGVIDMLIDLSHGDDDEEEVGMCTLVYVPTLGSYMVLWMSLRLFGMIFSQFPILWYYRNTK